MTQKSPVTFSHLVEFPKKRLSKQKERTERCSVVKVLEFCWAVFRIFCRSQLINCTRSRCLKQTITNWHIYSPHFISRRSRTKQNTGALFARNSTQPAAHAHTHFGPNRRARASYALRRMLTFAQCITSEIRHRLAANALTIYCYSRVQGKLEITKQRLIQVET